MKSTKTSEQGNARKSVWNGEDKETLWTMLVVCGLAAFTFGVNVGRCAMLGQDVICLCATVASLAVGRSIGRELILRRHKK